MLTNVEQFFDWKQDVENILTLFTDCCKREPGWFCVRRWPLRRIPTEAEKPTEALSEPEIPIVKATSLIHEEDWPGRHGVVEDRVDGRVDVEHEAGEVK